MKVKSFKKQIREARQPRIYETSDEWGSYMVRESTKKVIVKNGEITRIPGITVKIMTKPSKKYQAKIKKRKEEYKKQLKIKQVETDRENIINERIREMAIRELKSEGKID